VPEAGACEGQNNKKAKRRGFRQACSHSQRLSISALTDQF
jgi:hypothetical protein